MVRAAGPISHASQLSILSWQPRQYKDLAYINWCPYVYTGYFYLKGQKMFHEYAYLSFRCCCWISHHLCLLFFIDSQYCFNILLRSVCFSICEYLNAKLKWVVLLQVVLSCKLRFLFLCVHSCYLIMEAIHRNLIIYSILTHHMVVEQN